MESAAGNRPELRQNRRLNAFGLELTIASAAISGTNPDPRAIAGTTKTE